APPRPRRSPARTSSVSRPWAGTYIREETLPWRGERPYLDVPSDRPGACDGKRLVKIVDADESDCAHCVRLGREGTVDEDRTPAAEPDGRGRVGGLQAS